MATPDGLTELVELLKVIGAPAAVCGLGWWLKGQFQSVKDHAAGQLDKHELVDQSRHTQNLVRFAKINVKLGIANGHDEDELGEPH